jgi:hypothetical protein
MQNDNMCSSVAPKDSPKIGHSNDTVELVPKERKLSIIRQRLAIGKGSKLNGDAETSVSSTSTSNISLTASSADEEPPSLKIDRDGKNYSFKRLPPGYDLDNQGLAKEVRLLNETADPRITALIGKVGDPSSIILCINQDNIMTTLPSQIYQWKLDLNKIMNKRFMSAQSKHDKIRSRMDIRIHVAYDIATAMKDLHANKYVDVKPLLAIIPPLSMISVIVPFMHLTSILPSSSVFIG